MINKLTYIESEQKNPYENLAVEEYLLLHCEDHECIFYLWQNQHTVVIGRNQNAWKECLLTKLEEENGHLARRLSGGGAVYHDLGNLNFTFLIKKEDYSVDRQLRVIIKGLEKLGIHAEKSGRNDVLVDGKKISGNAFYEQGVNCYHHGTLMVNVNMEDLSRYLTVSKDKLRAKGVDSVRSRVGNLREFRPELTMDDLKKALREAFEEEYGLRSEILAWEDLPKDDIRERRERFSSWKWLYGRKLEFQYEMETRFAWGNLNLQFEVQSGIIQDIKAYSDSLFPEIIERLPEALKGVRYDREAVCAAVPQDDPMLDDIYKWLKTAEF